LPGGPCQISFEPGGGILHPLHIFVNPPERDIPDPKDPNLYYGPGYHEANEVDIRTGRPSTSPAGRSSASSRSRRARRWRRARCTGSSCTGRPASSRRSGRSM
jgi:hypothetical protein